MNIQVATLSLVDGQKRATPSEMGHVSVRQGMLCILVEVSAPIEAWDHASGQLVAQAIDTFALSQVNENNALQSVVHALNNYLLTLNQQLSEEKQIWAGLNAAFIRHNQLFLVQAGPSLAYIARQGAVRHYPPQQEGQSAQISTPLGYAADIECRLARFTLQPNDMILLSASHLPTLGSEHIINQALQYGPHEVTEALMSLASTNDFSALVLQYEPSPTQPTPSIKSKSKSKPKAAAHQAAPQAPSVRDELRQAAKEAIIFAQAPANNGAVLPIPQPSSATNDSAQKKNVMPKKAPPKKTVQSANSTVKPPPQAPQESSDSHPSLLRRLIAMLVAIVARLIGGFSLFITAFSDWLAPRRSTLGPFLDQLAYRFWAFVHRLTHIIKRILKQVLPGDQSDSSQPRQASAPAGDGTDFVKLLTSVIPIVLLLISIGLWYLQGDSTISAQDSQNYDPAVVAVQGASDIESLLSEANAFINEASSVDEEQAQKLLNQANERLQQAEGLTPDQSQLMQISELREQAQALQIQADKISRPSSLKQVSLVPENEPAILIHGSQTLFMLEKNSSTVYRLPTKSQPVDGLNQVQSLLTAHQTLGDTQLIGTPEMIAWVPGSAVLHDKLIIITEEKQIFDYNSTNSFIRLLSSHPPATTIQSADGYAGNLYLLTAQEKQIWKYEVDARGEYPLAPQAWLNPTGQKQIQNPIDMAIDGYIFLLEEGGQVARFEGGQLSKENFALEAVTPPLTNPVAITKIAPEETDMFVADTQRVLRFNKDGAFITDYRGELGNDWGIIRDIAVDEQLQTLYVLSSNGIYLVDIGENEQAQAGEEAGE